MHDRASNDLKQAREKLHVMIEDGFELSFEGSLTYELQLFTSQSNLFFDDWIVLPNFIFLEEP